MGHGVSLDGCHLRIFQLVVEERLLDFEGVPFHVFDSFDAPQQPELVLQAWRIA